MSPTIRALSGAPDDVELAAVTAVLLGLAAAARRADPEPLPAPWSAPWRAAAAPRARRTGRPARIVRPARWAGTPHVRTGWAA